MPLSTEEIRQIATVTADEVMDRVTERDHVSLMLNSIPYAFSEGSPGIVVDEAVAGATPCRYIEYRPGKRLAFSKGIVGALSDEQEKDYCPEWIKIESPGLQRRLERWMEAVEAAKKEVAAIPKGERLGPWLAAMSRELKARGIAALATPGHHSNPNPGGDGAEVIIGAKLNPKFPTPTQPQHRFDKELGEAPWTNAVAATIYLDDPAWELLGWPKELRVVISGAP